jgi:TRAP-type mannitol/chloroaromatic compound transport system substrate-binding protein
MTRSVQPRRSWLKVTAVAGAALGSARAAGAALSAPAVAKARQVASFRFQSTWPARDIFHEYAHDFARKVNDMTTGRLRLEVLPAGSVVPAFQLLEAVAKGVLDGGHGVVAYWYDKDPAVALWGSGPAFGMDPNMVLSWHYYGGGRQLLDEIYRRLDLPVRSFLYGPMPTQPLGWFRKPVASVADMRGLQFRTVGLAVDVFAMMGAAVNPIAAGDIVPALEQGLLDAAEFNNASSDRALGFPAVAKNCMLQSFHQASEQFEVIFNRDRYDALAPDLKAIIEFAVQAASADMSWKAIDRYSRDYVEMRDKQGVRFTRTPEAILRAQLAAWEKIIAEKAAGNEMFRRVLESMRTYAQRCGAWQNDTTVDYGMAHRHYFATKSPTK